MLLVHREVLREVGPSGLRVHTSMGCGTPVPSSFFLLLPSHEVSSVALSHALHLCHPAPLEF